MYSLLQRERPAVVYLTAALTDVDYCERHPDEGYAINVAGVQHVVSAAGAAGARVVFFSTDYIFDGGNGPYREDAPARPLGEYGRQKLYAEHLAALQASHPLIIRTTGVYSWERQGKNFVARLVRSLRAGSTARIPDDQVGSPAYAPDLARATVELVRRGASGVFHVCGPTCVSRFGFAVAIARAFGLDEERIYPVSTAELGQAARRPLKGGLVVDKTQAFLGRSLVGYEDGLRQMAASEKAGSRQD